MSEYYPLVDRIAREFHIVQGDKETDSSYQARVIYSLLGRMGYASLWDIEEDGDTKYVSIQHFQNRIRNVLKCYCDVYSDLQAVFFNIENLCKEIEKIYRATGVIYHKNNQLAPAAEYEATVDNIAFTRGKQLSEKQCISGIGTYIRSISQQHDVEGVKHMFQLHSGRMDDYWYGVLKKIQWKSMKPLLDLQYLRTEPPFSRGYWKDKRSVDTGISLARTQGMGNQCYYIYRAFDELVVSQLPDWMTIGGAYRSLSNGCLMALDTLPKAHYVVDGSIVILNLSYLYPTAELNFLSLYSWPVQYREFGKHFTRIFSKEVFLAIKSIFETMGYEFMEAK
jgi:hypothetical protein